MLALNFEWVLSLDYGLCSFSLPLEDIVKLQLAWNIHVTIYDTIVGLGGANVGLRWLKLWPRGIIIHIQFCNTIGIMQLLILENSQFIGNQMYIIANQ